MEITVYAGEELGRAVGCEGRERVSVLLPSKARFTDIDHFGAWFDSDASSQVLGEESA